MTFVNPYNVAVSRLVADVFMPCQKVARYYVIPSVILSVRPSALHNFVSAP